MGPFGNKPSSGQPHQPIEPLIWLLTGLVVFLLLMVIAVSKWSPSDGQTFQVVSGTLMTFSGVLAGRISPKSEKKDAAHPTAPQPPEDPKP